MTDTIGEGGLLMKLIVLIALIAKYYVCFVAGAIVG
jgi:hypothetical protein